MTIGQIANMNAGGVSVARTSKSTYGSFHNTNKTQNLTVVKYVRSKCRVFDGTTGTIAAVRGFPWYNPLQRF
jgi:hypothetical protein